MHFSFLSIAVFSAITSISARSLPQDFLPQEPSRALQKRVPIEWSYHGCWTDIGDRQLGGDSYHDDSMTPSNCISFCESKGYTFAGVEYARECFCGYNLKSVSVKKEDNECDMACKGDNSLMCGGPNRLNVFTSNALSQIATNLGPVGWSYKSCYEDSVYARTLAFKVNTLGGNNVLACTTACKTAGYKYAGVEWSSECWCDNTINFSRASDVEGCDMVCDGNKLEYCGGSQKLNIYEFATSQSSTAATTPVTTSSTTTTDVPTTTLIISSTTTTVQTTTTTTHAPTTSSSTTTTQTSTTATTTTTTGPPALQTFVARVSGSYQAGNGQLMKTRPGLNLNIATAGGYPVAIFSIEKGTNRLKEGRDASNWVAVDTATGGLYASGPWGASYSNLVCDPAVVGQKLVCRSETGGFSQIRAQWNAWAIVPYFSIPNSQFLASSENVDWIVENVA